MAHDKLVCELRKALADDVDPAGNPAAVNRYFLSPPPVTR